MEREKEIFASFNGALPQFSGETIKEWDVVEEWYTKRNLAAPAAPLDRRPDVIALTASDRKIGIELKSWLDEQQIGEARRREQIEDGLLRAIGDQGPNQTQHIDFVWLSPKEVRFDASDADGFRLEILALVEETDQGWTAKEQWEQECNQITNDLCRFPILAKYLNHVDFHPARRGQRNIRWITFPCRGGAYNPREMRETLSRALLDYRADRRYEDLARRVGLQEVYLLVHYDLNAFGYNHPFDEPDVGFCKAAEFARNALGGDAGYFARIFLLNALQGEEESYRIA